MRVLIASALALAFASAALAGEGGCLWSTHQTVAETPAPTQTASPATTPTPPNG